MVKKNCTMLSASLGTQSAQLATPANPALALKWGPNLVVKQLQIDENERLAEPYAAR